LDWSRSLDLLDGIHHFQAGDFLRLKNSVSIDWSMTFYLLAAPFLLDVKAAGGLELGAGYGFGK